MGCGPGWIGSLPAKALQVRAALGVKDHALVFKQLLLVASCTDSALRVDDTLPGHGWLWSSIAQGCHGIAHLACGHRWSHHRGDLSVGGDLPGWNLPDDFIDTVVKYIGHRGHPQMNVHICMRMHMGCAQSPTSPTLRRAACSSTCTVWPCRRLAN